MACHNMLNPQEILSFFPCPEDPVFALRSRQAVSHLRPAAAQMSRHIDYASAPLAATLAFNSAHQETTMISKACALAVAALWLSAPAVADDATPDTNGGRYMLNKSGDGFVRLDTQTGAVAYCTERSVGWACQTAPEDRSAFESEIARLRSENAALKQALLSHNLPLPSGAAPETPSGQPAGHGNDITIHLPDDADIDRAVTYMGQIWQRFVDAVTRAQRQMMNKS
jgi:hypothetical protein